MDRCYRAYIKEYGATRRLGAAPLLYTGHSLMAADRLCYAVSLRAGLGATPRCALTSIATQHILTLAATRRKPGHGGKVSGVAVIERLLRLKVER